MGLFSKLLKDPKLTHTISFILFVLIIVLLYLVYDRSQREEAFLGWFRRGRAANQRGQGGHRRDGQRDFENPLYDLTTSGSSSPLQVDNRSRLQKLFKLKKKPMIQSTPPHNPPASPTYELTSAFQPTQSGGAVYAFLDEPVDNIPEPGFKSSKAVGNMRPANSRVLYGKDGDGNEVFADVRGRELKVNGPHTPGTVTKHAVGFTQVWA
tara:strand:+ start:204 stop:830 length:627 start_codon:yes stop_codon:yes gene_type:complete